ncbi:hypothetical protein [Sulfuracidifex tepidarius]|uniref:PIN domain-containing protein n=1 Tax=Sulfuracidifex tepidarius TaxID=1294262 RepID=A0A510DZN3_9CREN|nr:hypothetical protein [Sulfuracidifex tepidarius]BBG25703.1 hypothetical protein IC007_0208 [Sulfuracidifex tepidarius]
MERSTKTCALFIVNRSDYIFESTMSSIVRTFETFDIDLLLVFYAGFTRNLFNAQSPRGLKELFGWIQGKGTEVVLEEASAPVDVDAFRKWIDEKTMECGKVIVVPTTSASLTAYLLGRVESEKLATVSYVFTFGPWTNYFYPYVPRPLETMRVINGEIKTNLNPSKLDGFPGYLSDKTFNMNVEKIVVELNKKTSSDVLELHVKEKDRNSQDKLLLSSDTFNLNDFLNKIHNRWGCEETINEALLLSGAFELKITKGNKEDTISSLTREKVLIDTNLLFYGIHNYELRDLIVPKCVRNEVTINSVQTKSRGSPLKSALSEIVEDVLNSVLSHARLIPSEDLWCDIAIPKIDPDLIEGAYLLTGDKKAYERWRKSTIGKYTEPLLIKVPTLTYQEGVKRYSHDIDKHVVQDVGRRYMSIITIALLLSRIRDISNIKVSLCWKGGKPIEVSYS